MIVLSVLNALLVAAALVVQLLVLRELRRMSRAPVITARDGGTVVMNGHVSLDDSALAGFAAAAMSGDDAEK